EQNLPPDLLDGEYVGAGDVDAADPELRPFHDHDPDRRTPLDPVYLDVRRLDAGLQVAVVVVELDDAIDVLVQALPLHRPRDEQFAAGNVEGQELAPLRGHDLADLLGRQPVRPFDHDPIDPDLPSFADPERDADVPVGELLHVGVDLDLEVAFRLVVLLQLLRGATDVDRVVNGPELDVGLLRERVRLDLLVSREDHVTDE